jgi:hypothetical protein
MKAKGWVITSAALIAGVRLWMQVRGKTKTPFREWIVGYGALFVILSVLAEAMPSAAAPLAGTIVLSDFLLNGEALFTDLSSIITGGESADSVLVATPFAPSTPTSTSTSKG